MDRNRWLYIIPCVMILFLTGKVCAASGQEVEKISLVFKNMEMKTVFKEIKAQSEYDFVYSARVLDDKIRVSLNLHDVDIKTALKACLDPLNVDFMIDGRLLP